MIGSCRTADPHRHDCVLHADVYLPKAPGRCPAVVSFGGYNTDLRHDPADSRRASPPALKAFFANEVTTDIFRHIYQFGGVPASYFLGIWAGANFTDEALNRHARVVIARASQLEQPSGASLAAAEIGDWLEKRFPLA